MRLQLLALAFAFTKQIITNMNIVYIAFTSFILVALTTKARAIYLYYRRKDFPKLKAEIAFFVIMLVISLGILLSINKVFTNSI